MTTATIESTGKKFELRPECGGFRWYREGDTNGHLRRDGEGRHAGAMMFAGLKA
jgi:hypothetical protein